MSSLSSHLRVLLLNYLTPVRTDCLFLFEDNTFTRGLLMNHTKDKQTRSFLPGSGIRGTWRAESNGITLFHAMEPVETLVFDRGADCHISASKRTTSFFYTVGDPDLLEEALMLIENL